MKLSVIIVSYNVKYYLEQCLESLYRALKDIDAEVFVVDNHSHDGSVSYLKERFPDTRFIASSHNLGFARANNLAIQQCKGEYVLLLNPDTVVGEDVIMTSISFMDSHPKAGGHGVQMLNDCGEKALESRRGLPSPLTAFYKMTGLCKRFPTNKRLAHYYMGGLSWDKPGQIEVISGAYCFLRKAALDRIGLLDEDFFMYGEDIDLSYRLLKGNYENWYLPTRILHYKGESTQKSSFRYVHVFYDAMFIFFRKHYGGMSLLLRLPIKTAIFIKASCSLVRTLCYSIRKYLGFNSFYTTSFPHYVFLGGQEMTAQCRRIAMEKGLSAEYYTGDKESLWHKEADIVGQNDDANKQICIIFDTEMFTYQEIFDRFSAHPMANIHIGFYHKKPNVIITTNEIIEGNG